MKMRNAALCNKDEFENKVMDVLVGNNNLKDNKLIWTKSLLISRIQLAFVTHLWAS